MATKKPSIPSSVLEIYNEFHRPEFLEWDPLEIIRGYRAHYQNLEEKRLNAAPPVELVALISALFAFGNVKQIRASVSKAISILESLDSSTALKSFRHRIYTGADLLAIYQLYLLSTEKYGSLQGHFEHHYDPASHANVLQSLEGVIQDYTHWSRDLENRPGKFFFHMLTAPSKKSTCKRWLMFLKWVVRPDDGIDLGLWSNSKIPTRALIIPVDTHIAKISKKFKFTKLKSPNLKMALEITESLKKIDPSDPTRFDFSLCRWGMFHYRKLSSTDYIKDSKK